MGSSRPEPGHIADPASAIPQARQGFTFDRAREAYEYLSQGRHFGKVVVTMQ